MANVNSPFGLSPVRYLNGSAWNQQCNLYCIPSTDTNQYGIGDIVLSLKGGDANGVPYANKAVAASIPRGVIVGVDPTLTSGISLQGTPLTLETIAIPATKARDYYIYVVDDPMTIFEVQADNATSTTAVASLGGNALPVIANPAAGSPFSGTTLGIATIAVTATHMLKILGLTRKPGADFTAYTRFLVSFNVHELKSVGTLGVAP
jgi:hypothetical protein